MNDEQSIRDLVEKWLTATRAGDPEAVLSLMAGDVIFMVPGTEPFGKQQFAANFGIMKSHKIDGTGDIKEIKLWVSGRGCAIS